MSVENKTQFEIDYEGGKQNESSILNIIRTYFNRDISHVTDAFSSYDFECDTFKYELKVFISRMAYQFYLMNKIISIKYFRKN